jgi:predicted acetyltransferase
MVTRHDASDDQIIRQLTADDLDALTTIVAGAYPSVRLTTDAARQAFRERVLAQDADPTIDFYGLFRGGVAFGTMRLHDFTMTVRGAHLPTGGVAFIAVDLAHKKEHVARDLVAHFLRLYRQRGAPLAALYPFRPDFYRAMGFGYGTQVNLYRVRPNALPDSDARHRVRLALAADVPQLAECYDRYAARTHGMMAQSDLDRGRYLANPEQRVACYEEDGAIRGYAAFRLTLTDDANFLLQDLDVRELVYEAPAALAGLLAFLRTQADQVRRVLFATQDETFHHVLSDPRNGTDHLLPVVNHETNTQGVGLMYRVLDVPGCFAALGDARADAPADAPAGAPPFGDQTLTVTITTRDTFLPENAGSVAVRFEHGYPRVLAGRTEPADAAITLDVADLSSLLMGCVTLRSLHDYGLATVSDLSTLDALTRLFQVERKPICMTQF